MGVTRDSRINRNGTVYKAAMEPTRQDVAGLGNLYGHDAREDDGYTTLIQIHTPTCFTPPPFLVIVTQCIY